MKRKPKERCRKNRKEAASGFRGSRGRCGLRRLSEAREGKIAGAAALIFQTGKGHQGVGALQETLKWGQPSYLTPETKAAARSGSTG